MVAGSFFPGLKTEVLMKNEEVKQGREDRLPDDGEDNQWLTELMSDDVDGELDQVTAQLRESYSRLFSSLETLDKEIESAIEEGDEMKYQAAKIKKSLVQSRMSELEALKIF